MAKLYAYTYLNIGLLIVGVILVGVTPEVINIRIEPLNYFGSILVIIGAYSQYLKERVDAKRGRFLWYGLAVVWLLGVIVGLMS